MPNSVGRNDNCLAKAGKLSILQTSRAIFDIRQHYVCILFISHNRKEWGKNERTKCFTTYNEWEVLSKKV